MSTHKVRIALFREEMAEFSLDAAIVHWLPNVRYLTGFTGSNGILIVTQEKATLFTDPRYTTQAHEETKHTGVKVVIAKGPTAVAAEKGLARSRDVGFERSHLTWALYNHFAVNLKRVTLHPMDGIIERHRMFKSPEEEAAIRASVQTNSQAFAAALTRFRAGMTENDFAAEIEYQMRLLGAEKPAFETIVAFRERSALPHARPGAAKLDRNGLLLIDMGTFQGGYASDMTRCVHLGKPGAKIRTLYRAVAEAQQAAIHEVKPGIRAEQVDNAARRVLRHHGLDKAFLHSTGHGLGLEIHEIPRLGRKDKTLLQPGMAITIEPGAYLEGIGGVRIEDTVLVTADGVEILTPTTKELVTL